MPLPVSLLQAAENNPVLVELKDGTTYNGTLVDTDSFMNVNLKEVTCTSKEGTQFWKLSECYVRGSTIKYFRMSEELLDQIPSEPAHEFKPRGGGAPRGGSFRGSRGGSSTRGGNTRGGPRGGGSTRGGGGGASRGEFRGGRGGGAGRGRGQ
ncbi:hypothetical protein BASA81_008824 [Batrachochytrium salamandrivorans]|nr:hypothetical protein BASA81_008824 [Batrachochytrium salamandrivorans]